MSVLTREAQAVMSRMEDDRRTAPFGTYLHENLWPMTPYRNFVVKLWGILPTTRKVVRNQEGVSDVHAVRGVALDAD